MATVVVAKSESADLYVFAVDKDDVDTAEGIAKLFAKEWYFDDVSYIETVYSSDFHAQDVMNFVQREIDALETEVLQL